MIRTQIYLTKQQKEKLDMLSQTSGRSQSELIREAIDHFLVLNHPEKGNDIMAAFGIWKDRDDLPDFDELRKGWDKRLKDFDMRSDDEE